MTSTEMSFFGMMLMMSYEIMHRYMKKNWKIGLDLHLQMPEEKRSLAIYVYFSSNRDIQRESANFGDGFLSKRKYFQKQSNSSPPVKATVTAWQELS